MLLPKNLNPLDSIYFNGAIVLKNLQNHDQGLDMIQLYNNVKKDKEMTFPVFVLCLDWLYIANLAKIDNEGCVHLCS
ncbi:ABC-three component system middle component 6 [Lysinibacillus sp. NPDC093216]|uniref:ABC-three component system middle component 6 n=1 Tax=Lysinibacillus sp. NPDC093216 TaxID=3390576 RepID=UPI003D0502E2